MMPCTEPEWVLGLVAAVALHEYQCTAGAEWCFTTALAAVPADVREQATGYAAGYAAGRRAGAAELDAAKAARDAARASEEKLAAQIDAVRTWARHDKSVGDVLHDVLGDNN